MVVWVWDWVRAGDKGGGRWRGLEWSCLVGG